MRELRTAQKLGLRELVTDRERPEGSDAVAGGGHRQGARV